MGARCRQSCGTCAATDAVVVQTTGLMATAPPKDVAASACGDNGWFVDGQGRRCVDYVDAPCDGLRSVGYAEQEVLRIVLRAGTSNRANMTVGACGTFCRAPPSA
mmetsp:Transcript_10089/g.20281  ORF Transcript_10089/g.20281 Transcript_10089/m.20281 type:complete len:105 (-) Transcript_10089:548-862(-)